MNIEETSLKHLLDVDEVLEKEVIDVFQNNSEKGDVFISMIAPYVGVRLTPSKESIATIGLSEEFGVETVIEKIKKLSPKSERLYLLINSPGGFVGSSYKVAKALRENFKEIIVFVPHIAASGGTLIALTGNKVVMGMMSQITPIDPHSNGIPALSVKRGFETATDMFKKLSEEDAPYTWRILAEKHDPIKLDMALASLGLSMTYAKEILSKSGYKDEKIDMIAEELVYGCILHEQVINLDKAKKIGINVFPHTEYLKLWNAFRFMLGKYVLRSANKHIIRYWINNPKTKTIKSTKKRTKRGTKK